MTDYPLVVDLDGTLIQTDMLHESAITVAQKNILRAFRLPFILFKGKAYLKRYLANKYEFDPSTLPYNTELINWLRQEKEKGRRLILCTASDQGIAEVIGGYINMFDEIIASDGLVNLSGSAKAQILSERFGVGKFDYVGNSFADVPVWEVSRNAILVSAPASLQKIANAKFQVDRIFQKENYSNGAWYRVVRLHQWLKNLLLFVPLIASHDVGNLEAWSSLALAFLAFGLCAASVYVANDLIDLESDRSHPRKRGRPFASGAVPVWKGVIISPALLVISFFISHFVGAKFTFCLFAYFIMTCAYSFVLKRVVIVDCMTLAMLYTMRVIAGAVSIGHSLSFWLLAFSLFLFLSLAFVKRYAELEMLNIVGKGKIPGRGYELNDASLVQTMGITAGYASVLILSLYLNSEAVLKLYAIPNVIWGAVFLLLFWVNWVWFQAHRGRMHDDPLVFALRDRTSLITGVAFLCVLAAGAVGRLW